MNDAVLTLASPRDMGTDPERNGLPVEASAYTSCNARQDSDSRPVGRMTPLVTCEFWIISAEGAVRSRKREACIRYTVI